MDFRAFENTVNVFVYDPLIAEAWTSSHTLPMIQEVKKSGLSYKEVAELLHNPTAARCLMYYDIFMAKFAKLGPEVYREIFSFYSDILNAICIKDPFVENGNNLIHSESEVQAMIAKSKPATPEIARALGKLSNACYNISYGLYSDMNPQLVYDNLGPYYQADNRMFALKIFYNLKPTDLWPETSSLPIGNFEVGCYYENVTLKVDTASHGVYAGDQINGLKGWWCTGDGKDLSIEEIHLARQQIEKSAVSIYTQVKKFDLEKKKEFYYFQKAWGYKKLYDRLGLDWRPDQAMLAQAKLKPLFNKWNMPDDEANKAEALGKLMDPRIELPENI